MPEMTMDKAETMGDPFEVAKTPCKRSLFYRNAQGGYWDCIYGLATWNEMCEVCRERLKAQSREKGTA